jgi:hypothetical protein
MAKHALKRLDTAALAVALDHAEEHGQAGGAPAPLERPDQCVYLRYTLDEGEPACKTSHGEGQGKMKDHPPR